MLMRWKHLVIALSLTAVHVGCDPGSMQQVTLVDVQGELLLDNRPVSDARVVFVLENPNPGQEFFVSSGQTNIRGEFQLTTKGGRQGAIAGKHRVYISRAKFAARSLGSENLDRDETIPGKSIGQTDSPSQKLAAGEQIPFYYNLHSELQCDVVAGRGIQRVKFELSTKDPLLVEDAIDD